MNSIVGRLTEFVNGSQQISHSQPSLPYSGGANKQISSAKRTNTLSAEDIIPLGNDF